MIHHSAIIGYGYMGPMHRDILEKDVPEIKVTGVYDIRPECREAARAQGLTAYESLEALLDDSSIDLVTIATPNDIHKDLSIRCLRTGKNVVCEKPVTLCTEDLAEIMAAAKETGKLFSIHHNRRWDRDYQQIKTIFADHTLGKPHFIESRVDGSGRGMYGWRGFHQNGGGLLLDWGIHLLDQLLDLIDSPVISVDAHILSLCTPEADDNARVLLRYENGVSALCEVTSGCFLPTPRWLVQCEHGTVRIDAIDGPGVMMKADTTDERRSLPSIVYMPEGPVTREMTLPMSEAVSVPLPEVNSCWADFYHNIARAIEGLEPARVTPEQAMRVLKVVELAFESERQQRAISCRI